MMSAKWVSIDIKTTDKLLLFKKKKTVANSEQKNYEKEVRVKRKHYNAVHQQQQRA